MKYVSIIFIIVLLSLSFFVKNNFVRIPLFLFALLLIVIILVNRYKKASQKNVTGDFLLIKRKHTMPFMIFVFIPLLFIGFLLQKEITDIFLIVFLILPVFLERFLVKKYQPAALSISGTKLFNNEFGAERDLKNLVQIKFNDYMDELIFKFQQEQSYSIQRSNFTKEELWTFILKMIELSTHEVVISPNVLEKLNTTYQSPAK